MEALQHACASASKERAQEERTVSAAAHELSRQKDDYKQQIAGGEHRPAACMRQAGAWRPGSNNT